MDRHRDHASAQRRGKRRNREWRHALLIARQSPDWTREKNARRVALINKKHDKQLTAAEKKELHQLMAEADAYRDAAAPVRNQILELILAGLEKLPPKASKR